MGAASRAATWWIVLGVLLMACAPTGPAPSREAATGGEPGRSSGPKRVLGAVMADLPSPRSQLDRAAGGTLPGAREFEQLVHAGLGVEDERGNVRPQLAEDVPTVENGLWRVFQDGRMETTWKIRPNVRWHDGTPFTAEDLLFTARVAQ